MYPFTEAGGQTRLPSVCNISIWYYQVVREEHSMQYDLIIRHAHLHRRDGLIDIAVKGGQFARIANELYVGRGPGVSAIYQGICGEE